MHTLTCNHCGCTMLRADKNKKFCSIKCGADHRYKDSPKRKTVQVDYTAPWSTQTDGIFDVGEFDNWIFHTKHNINTNGLQRVSEIEN